MTEKESIATIVLVASLLLCSMAAMAADLNPFPVRGFCIAAPQAKDLDRFIAFLNEELAPRGVNTLVLRVDYNFQYESHPELRNESALSRQDAEKLVAACRTHGIQIIPQVNLLGHQSWAGSVGNLLRVYPEFDETPHVTMPAKYEWPNADGLYCKSYCPLHPKVHEVVFALVDEACDAFQAEAFHAGMDEVFYIGDDKCPRCSGRDKAELFAGEVRVIRDHLARKGRSLWIWGDRLIDGKTTGLGIWEASFNNTHRAIDMIPKDVVICDWHYDRPDPTAVYFAMKGFKVVSCPWRFASVGVAQAQDMARWRTSAAPEMRDRFLGVMQTVWSNPSEFLDKEYRTEANSSADPHTSWNCFKALADEIRRLRGQ